jgi:RNA 2',3'-cyclic 3'-phosphodiesterase
MRLFTAISLVPEVMIRLERLISALRPEALINWSPLDNLHITTKFIGEWPERQFDDLDSALSSIPGRDPFEVEIRGLGWFPNERSPRVLWAGVQGEKPLLELVQDTETSLLSLGITKEDRAFSPHLTLARIKRPVPLQSLRQKISDMHSTSLGSFAVSQFALYQSMPGSNASIYRKLRQYAFEKARSAAKL